MPAREILILGNPLLHAVCDPVSESDLPAMAEVLQDLEDTLFAFRATHGVGRAIAAPQIGVLKRAVYMNIGEPVVMLNPHFLSKSVETFDLWDDCMSFPDVLVRVRRHLRCTLSFRDLHWREHTVELEGDLSELLQHELDHLDGILAFARAVDTQSFAYRTQRHLLPGDLVASPELTAARHSPSARQIDPEH